mgnify:CR=1 FL=1
MKLSPDQIAAAKAVLGADPLDEDHPATPQLKEAFGDQTFYVDTNGLLVFETTEEPGTEAELKLVAAWTGEDRNQLGVVEPVQTGIKVDLGQPTATDGEAR